MWRTIGVWCSRNNESIPAITDRKGTRRRFSLLMIPTSSSSSSRCLLLGMTYTRRLAATGVILFYYFPAALNVKTRSAISVLALLHFLSAVNKQAPHNNGPFCAIFWDPLTSTFHSLEIIFATHNSHSSNANYRSTLILEIPIGFKTDSYSHTIYQSNGDFFPGQN